MTWYITLTAGLIFFVALCSLAEFFRDRYWPVAVRATGEFAIALWGAWLLFK